MKSLSDEELVTRFQQSPGPSAQAPFANELFSRHYSRVALWCFRIAGDREWASDLAQEVMTKAWSHLPHFRNDSKFTTWLYMIARNHCFDASKARARRREQGMEAELLDTLSEIPAGFDDQLEQSQRVDMARELMAKELTDVETQVMTLHFAEGLPLDAVSRLLRMENASGAKAFVVSAKRKLKIAVDRLAARGRRNPAGYPTEPRP